MFGRPRFARQEGRESLATPILPAAEGRLTLPLLLLLPRLDPIRRSWIEAVLEDRAFRRIAPEQILELVTAEGTIEEVEILAEETAIEAREALAFLPRGEAREALEFAPEFVLHRRA